MNPLTPREELELRITALLMGELSPAEAAALHARIAADPELSALHARLRHAVDLLREARTLPEQTAPAEPLSLSKERREKLLATFRGKWLGRPAHEERAHMGETPKLLPTPVRRKPRRDWKWMVPMGLAASVVFVTGVAICFPVYAKMRSGPAMRRYAVDGDSDGMNRGWASQSGKISKEIELPRGTSRGGSDKMHPSPEAAAPPDASVATKSFALYAESKPNPTPAQSNGIYLPSAAPAEGGDQSGLGVGGGAPVAHGFVSNFDSGLSRHVDGFSAGGAGSTLAKADNAGFSAARGEGLKTPPVTATNHWAFGETAGKAEDFGAIADRDERLQKFPGHPATTSLSSATSQLFREGDGKQRTDAEVKAKIYTPAPRVFGGIGTALTADGTATTDGLAVADNRSFFTNGGPLGNAPTTNPADANVALGDELAARTPTSGPATPPPALPPVLNLFAIPVVEPSAISEPLSTAGKININGPLAPFSTASPAKTEVTAERELHRRIQRESLGRDEIAKGREALKANDNEAAFSHYKNAAASTPDAPATAASREDAKRGLTEAGLRLAEEQITKGENLAAADSLKEVLQQNPDSPRAIKLLSNLEAPDIYNKKLTPNFRQKVEEMKQDHLDAQQYQDLARFDLADIAAQKALSRDRYNFAAEKRRSGIAEEKEQLGEVAQESTREQAMWEVSKEWERPYRRFDKRTVEIVNKSKASGATSAGEEVPVPKGMASAPETETRFGRTPTQATPNTALGFDVTSDYVFEQKAAPAPPAGQTWFGTLDGGNGRGATAVNGDAPALTREGAGTLTVSGGNRYEGVTSVGAGTLTVTGGTLVPAQQWGDQAAADLDLAPQAVEFEGFINYGSPIQTTSKDANGVETVNVITPSVINQPIFSTRKVTTNAPTPTQDFTAPVAGKPITAGNRSGSLAISENAIDALLFGTAGTSAITEPQLESLHQLTDESKLQPTAPMPQVDIVSQTASTSTFTLAKREPIQALQGVERDKAQAPVKRLAAIKDAEDFSDSVDLPKLAEKGKKADEKPVAEVQKQLAEPAAPQKPTEPPPTPQPEVTTKDNAFSTFSLNVSDVSFKLAGAALEKGAMPDVASVRSEEFINALDYRDPEAAPGAPLAFAAERARYPFAQNRDLLRLSVKTAAAGRQPGRPLNIVLLLDNSGSMERADRVRILKESLTVLAKQLQPADKLSIITFARTPRLWADGVTGDKASEFTARVGEITPQGGTDLGAAMDLGYTTALKHYQVGSVNRVVLMTDGAANLGNVSATALKEKVERHRKQGVAFDCFGIGWEGYNDDLLEQLSRNGDGRYGFINTPEAAATEFAGQLAGALRVAASDVKVQVEFNPARVIAYRQLGYAKHQLKKEQFRDNTVDAAEIGAAESGNALYAIEVNPRGTGDVATVRVRFKVPGTGDYHEHEWTVPFTQPAPALEQSSTSLKLAATAAAFSEFLAQSPYAAEVTTDRLLGMVNGIPAIYGADPRPAKLEWMIRQAKSISGR